MNTNRRKAIRELVEELVVLNERIMEILEEEEDYRDNMPENLMASERFEKADAACDSLSFALDDMQSVINNLEDACE